MKKVIFTAILLLVLGTAWMLYLDYDNRRFIESLPKPPAKVTRPVHTVSEVPVTPESSETIVPDMFTERAPVHPHPHTHTEGTEQTETTDFLSEDIDFETDFQEVDEGAPKLSVKECSIGELGLSEAEIEARKESFKYLNRFIQNPENWVSGRPGEVGFRFEIWTREDYEGLRRALHLPPLPPDSPVQTREASELEPQLPAH